MESEGLKNLVAKIDEIAREVEEQEEMPEWTRGFYSTPEEGVRFRLCPRDNKDFFWFEKNGYVPHFAKGKRERENYTFFAGFEPRTFKESEILVNARQDLLKEMKYEEFEKEFFRTIMEEPINPKRSVGGVNISMKAIKLADVPGLGDEFWWNELAFRTGITRGPFPGDIEIPGHLLESMK